ncbi:unnamed protein product [Amoebophrya sp. A25]|nr:unnamed protein product [Amoebophrya sp. A25]|eukprot:GSA25T00007887001.1
MTKIMRMTKKQGQEHLQHEDTKDKGSRAPRGGEIYSLLDVVPEAALVVIFECLDPLASLYVLQVLGRVSFQQHPNITSTTATSRSETSSTSNSCAVALDVVVSPTSSSRPPNKKDKADENGGQLICKSNGAPSVWGTSQSALFRYRIDSKSVPNDLSDLVHRQQNKNDVHAEQNNSILSKNSTSTSVVEELLDKDRRDRVRDIDLISAGVAATAFLALSTSGAVSIPVEGVPLQFGQDAVVLPLVHFVTGIVPVLARLPLLQTLHISNLSLRDTRQDVSELLMLLQEGSCLKEIRIGAPIFDVSHSSLFLQPPTSSAGTETASVNVNRSPSVTAAYAPGLLSSDVRTLLSAGPSTATPTVSQAGSTTVGQICAGMFLNDICQRGQIFNTPGLGHQETSGGSAVSTSATSTITGPSTSTILSTSSVANSATSSDSTRTSSSSGAGNVNPSLIVNMTHTSAEREVASQLLEDEEDEEVKLFGSSILARLSPEERSLVETLAWLRGWFSRKFEERSQEDYRTQVSIIAKEEEQLTQKLLRLHPSNGSLSSMVGAGTSSADLMRLSWNIGSPTPMEYMDHSGPTSRKMSHDSVLDNGGISGSESSGPYLDTGAQHPLSMTSRRLKQVASSSSAFSLSERSPRSSPCRMELENSDALISSSQDPASKDQDTKVVVSSITTVTQSQAHQPHERDLFHRPNMLSSPRLALARQESLMDHGPDDSAPTSSSMCGPASAPAARGVGAGELHQLRVHHGLSCRGSRERVRSVPANLMNRGGAENNLQRSVADTQRTDSQDQNANQKTLRRPRPRSGDRQQQKYDTQGSWSCRWKPNTDQKSFSRSQSDTLGRSPSTAASSKASAGEIDTTSKDSFAPQSRVADPSSSRTFDRPPQEQHRSSSSIQPQAHESSGKRVRTSSHVLTPVNATSTALPNTSSMPNTNPHSSLATNSSSTTMPRTMMNPTAPSGPSSFSSMRGGVAVPFMSPPLSRVSSYHSQFGMGSCPDDSEDDEMSMTWQPKLKITPSGLLLSGEGATQTGADQQGQQPLSPSSSAGSILRSDTPKLKEDHSSTNSKSLPFVTAPGGTTPTPLSATTSSTAHEQVVRSKMSWLTRSTTTSSSTKNKHTFDAAGTPATTSASGSSQQDQQHDRLMREVAYRIWQLDQGVCSVPACLMRGLAGQRMLRSLSLSRVTPSSLEAVPQLFLPNLQTLTLHFSLDRRFVWNIGHLFCTPKLEVLAVENTSPNAPCNDLISDFPVLEGAEKLLSDLAAEELEQEDAPEAFFLDDSTCNMKIVDSNNLHFNAQRASLNSFLREQRESVTCEPILEDLHCEDDPATRSLTRNDMHQEVLASRSDSKTSSVGCSFSAESDDARSSSQSSENSWSNGPHKKTRLSNFRCLRIRRMCLKVEEVRPVLSLLSSARPEKLERVAFVCDPALPLTVFELVKMRIGLGLPAFGAHRGGILGCREWPASWPAVRKFWPDRNSVTGFAVFKSDISFSEFGEDPSNHWNNRMSKKERAFFEHLATFIREQWLGGGEHGVEQVL